MDEQHRPADAQAYAAIRQQIMNHRLRPGNQLVEMDLAAKLGLSRTPIRMALKKLVHEGLVEYRPNRGHFVSEPDVLEVREAFWLRRWAESLAAAEAARRTDDERLSELLKLVDEEDAAYSRHEKALALHLSFDFHEGVAALSGNRFLHRLVVELNQKTNIQVAFYDYFQADPPRSPRDHRLILEAIARGDGDEAQRLMADHILDTERGLNLRDVDV